MAKCWVTALKAIFQYDFQTPCSFLLVRQSYWWGRMARASWQLLPRALLEIPGEQHSSWVCSLGSEAGQVFILVPPNKMSLRPGVVFRSPPFSWCAISKWREKIFSVEGDDVHKQMLTRRNKCLHVWAESREVTLRALQPAVTALHAMPGVWPWKYWGDRRTELLT